MAEKNQADLGNILKWFRDNSQKYWFSIAVYYIQICIMFGVFILFFGNNFDSKHTEIYNGITNVKHREMVKKKIIQKYCLRNLSDS